MSWRDADKTPCSGRLFSEYLEKRLGPTRPADEPRRAEAQGLAATMQARLEEVYFEMLERSARAHASRNPFAWRAAWRSIAWRTEKYSSETPFERVFVQPAAGDAGLAVGAAYYVHHQILGQPREFVMKHAYWGPEYSEQQIRAAIEQQRIWRRRVSKSPSFRKKNAASDGAATSPTGKFWAGFRAARNGVRARWETAASGRSAPRGNEGHSERRIKHREMFRPFAPSILAEATGEFFETSHPSPFMTFAYSVRPEKRGVLAAPTHVDGTGAAANRRARGQSAILAADSRVRKFDRRAGGGEYFVQRQRADCLPARRSDRLFPADAHGHAGARRHHRHQE